MQTDSIQTVEELLKEGKQEEAKDYLRQLLQQPLSDEERGALLVGFAAAYLALHHSAAEMHQDVSEETDTVERLSSLQRSIDEQRRS